MNPDGSSSFGDDAGHASAGAVPPLHPHEAARLASVREIEPLISESDRALQSVAREAQTLCEVPIAMVALMEEGEERVLAAVGTSLGSVLRHESVCAYTILEPDGLVVEELAYDPRFSAMPYVTGPPFVRFYAGVPILDATGLPLGAVCVFDTRPHPASSRCLLALRRLGTVASAVLEARLLLSDAHARYISRTESRTSQARLDELLARMVEPRPTCE